MDIPLLKKIHRRVRALREVRWRDAAQKFLRILSVKPYTMVEYPRLASMYDVMLESERFNDVEGAIVEAGSWNGGYALLMGMISDACGKKRHVWLFDSFEGLPAPSAVDRNRRGFLAKKGAAGDASETTVAKAFCAFDQTRVHVVKGWFEHTFDETLPKVGPIAYIHLDADLYEPTKYCLEQLWPLLSRGGIIFFDDYSYYEGCKKAVDEFLAKHTIGGLVRSVDETAYVRKV
ncbi:MAG TPA: TylF/MycF/NovP-related O-methyltransferase [Candidatus Paceibacterota bacterium]|nr:TylF/MycF/NovP-related O-methyltransferase [Candidatus Paceibacterota bacterium]